MAPCACAVEMGGVLTARIKMSTSLYECCICLQHARSSLSGILRHIREVHPHFEGRVPCGVEGCPATPASYEGLRQHLYRYHKRLLTGDEVLTGDETVAPGSAPDQEDQSESQDYELDDQPLQLESSASEELPTSTLLGAQFILKTRDGRKLTQVATNGIIQDTKIIVQSTVEAIQKKVFEAIRNTEIPLTDQHLATIDAVFADETVVDPFRGLETEYKQEKFIQEHFNYVVRLCMG